MLLESVFVSYHVLDAAQHCRGQDAHEEDHKVKASETPDEEVQNENVVTALDSNKLIVVAEVSSTKISKPRDSKIHHMTAVAD